MSDEITETEKKEVVTDNFAVDDEGEVVVYPEEEEKIPDADSDKEQSEEDKSEDPTKVDDATKAFNEKYPHLKGKTREEIAEINADATRKITSESTKRADAEKLLDEKNLTFEEKLDRLDPTRIQELVEEERNKLLRLDHDDEEYDKKLKEGNAVISVLETAYSKNYTQKIANDKINERINDEFILRQRKNFTDDGIDITDEEFETVTLRAKNYTEDGQLTTGSYDKALIDLYSSAQFAKWHEIKGGEKTRKEMLDTKTKETKTLGTGAGRTDGIKFENLKGRARDEFLANLSPAALQRLQDSLPKQF